MQWNGTLPTEQGRFGTRGGQDQQNNCSGYAWWAKKNKKNSVKRSGVIRPKKVGKFPVMPLKRTMGSRNHR